MVAMAKSTITSREGDLAQFQHTQLGVYLAGAFGLCYVWCSSAQGIVDHYHFSKKWFYLYGVLVAFAYLYMRPFVRRGLGSAHRGYLNFYSLYILWLCSALFCHLPSLEALGIDIKADVSLALSIAASSMMVLGVLHGLQAALIHFKWLAPAPGATQQALWSCIILNSLTLAAACSTYFQLCGNGTAGPPNSRQGTGFSAFLHDAVCVKVLAPITTKEYPTFSAWMLYGERNTTAATAAAATAAKRSDCSTTSWFNLGGSSNSSSCEADSAAVMSNSSNLVEFVLSVPGGSADDGSSVISPVFTMWITLVALYIINVLVDYVSAYDMSARHISELRRERVKDPDLALLAALSQAAGETFRQGAHQLAAAQQQRQQKQQKQQQHYSTERGREQGPRSVFGTKRSKSLELPSSARQPWSPRFMAERTLVNLLETTSSFSFKAAALLENIETSGFPTWQQLQSQARLGSLGGLATWEGLTALGDRLGSTKIGAIGTNGKRQGKQQRHKQQQQKSGMQQMRRASTDGLDTAFSQHNYRQTRQLGLAAAAAAEGSAQRSERRPRGKLHTRSKSLSSIQSAGTASGREDDDNESVREQQQQQQSQRQWADSSGSPAIGFDQFEREQHSMPIPSGLRPGTTGGFSTQQQHPASRLSDHSNSINYCSSPFAAAQSDNGFGLCGSFGSAISLYSPGSEGHDAQKIEQILAAAAAANSGGGASGGGKAPVNAAAAVTVATSNGGSRADSSGSLPSAVTSTVSNTAASDKQQATTVDTTTTAGQQHIFLEPRGTTEESELSELLDEGLCEPSGSGGCGGGGAGYEGPSPPFLDMVPWYSGTSADLFKTMFDLMISLKLFLGRFDMRTMQAATAASMADSFNDTPAEGDGFTYEHYQDKEELWVDFIADTGDGGNSTYTVARALAAPSLTVPTSSSFTTAQQQQQGPHVKHQQQSSVQLPRGDVLLIGGDLAYPNPSRDTYEQRLFVPFQEAMPPPPHYHPGRLVVHKPDLPPSFGVQEATAAAARMCPAGLSPRSSRYASAAALRSYLGPNVFAIPGNHDWIDGLETYIKQIMHKGWLGGWLMPQEKSYFALRLPAGWWVFGLDLALVGDIDMCQYRYFANVVERRLSPSDNVIIVTHEPIWLLEWFWASSSSSNLRQLVRGHLRGRARVHLAGDLHFYMRHSLAAHSKQQQQQQVAAATAAAEKAEQKVAAADQLLHMPTADPLIGIPGVGGLQQQHGGEAAASGGGASRSSSPISARPSDFPGGQQYNLEAAGSHVGLSLNGSSISRSRRSSSSSSSSGVESCSTPLPDQLQYNHHHHHHHHQQQQQGHPSWLSSRTEAHSADNPDAGSSPVGVACQTLPRLRTASPGDSHKMSAAAMSERTTADSSTDTHLEQQPKAATGTRQQVNKSGVKWAVPDGAAARCSGTGASANQQQQQHVAGNSSGDEPHHQQQQQQQHVVSLLDPEHLIVNGLGGAFLHPTHVFSYSRFACLEDEAAAATAAIYSSAEGAEATSYLSAVPISSCNSHSSSSSLAAAASMPSVMNPAASGGYLSSSQQYRQSSRGQSSLSVWDPDMLSWHCPMSPSGTSDIWEQQSLQGAAAAAAGHSNGNNPGQGVAVNKNSRGVADGAQQVDHDPVPMLRGPPAAPAPAAPAGRGMSCGSSQTGTVAASAAAGGLQTVGSSGVVSDGGVYKCAALFPTAEKSRKLGRKNLHLFRFKNSRFDVIGGALYFMSIVSTLPRCSAGAALLSATSLLDFIQTFIAEFTACWYDIFMNSYLSLITVVLFLLITLGFAKGGGVGAVSGERQQLQREQKRQRKIVQQQQQQQQQRSAGYPAVGASRVVKKPSRRSPVVGPFVKLRTGGSSTQLMVALLHAGTHLSLAVVLLLLLELGVEICIKYENLGNDGLHSMYRWFEDYQDQHFPDPMGLRDMAHKWSLGLYPGVIKAAMAVYDIPEAIAVARNTVCRAGSVAAGFAELSRVQLLAYYAGMLAYYWLLAIPAMGFVFGLYLYVCVCWFHVHYDEAFSALRIANFKGFSRLHITKDGDLEIFTLGIDRVPTCWREDDRWYSEQGAGSGRVAAHEAAYPSRWVPVVSSRGSKGVVGQQGVGSKVAGGSCAAVGQDEASMGFKVVDYLKVPRQRPGLGAVPV